MDPTGRNVIVTGGASGIGAALAAEFRDAGARVTVLDLPRTDSDRDRLDCDVADSGALKLAITAVEARHGPVEIFVSNAGVLSKQPDHAASATEDDWARCWSVNVLAHVRAARVLIPGMVARGVGHFVIVASAAGLLNQIGDAAYSATKHAAVSFAESLAITHRSDGIGVTVACPQYVATPLIGLSPSDAEGDRALLGPQVVAREILDAVRAQRFLVLPHREVAEHAAARARDHQAWIDGMVRLRARSLETFGRAGPHEISRLLRSRPR